MTSRFVVPLGVLVAVALCAGWFLAGGVPSRAAADDAGVITGQVAWCAPLPGPYGVAPGGVDGGSGTATPGAVAPETTPSELMPAPSADARPSIYPIPVPRPPRMIPAGAVLVAVQGTSLSARTGEDGKFRIEGVPVGPFLTVAGGPVAQMNGAVALRPNVQVKSAGTPVDIGLLTLSQPCGYYGPFPYAVPAADAPASTD